VEAVRHSFIAGRAVLRNILSHYINRRPQDIRFCYTAYGKPEIDGDDGTFRFNMSHSHDTALVAVTLNRRVGVDLEYAGRAPAVDRMRLARRFFSEREYRELVALPESKQSSGFLACWTRKEAFVKARGEGMFALLSRFDVSVDPDRPPFLVETRWDASDAGRWTLIDLYPGPDYTAVLAVEGAGSETRCWQWRPCKEDSE
jgi:4'-phosphopantetheinyl transferase